MAYANNDADCNSECKKKLCKEGLEILNPLLDEPLSGEPCSSDISCRGADLLSGTCLTGHCCSVNATACETGCGGTTARGSCYPLLEFSPLLWTANSVTDLGWPTEATVNEAVTFEAVPIDNLEGNVARKVYPQRTAPPDLKFKVRWTPKTSASPSPSGMDYAENYVGRSPPTGLKQAGDGYSDPSFTNGDFESSSSDEASVGNYTISTFIEEKDVKIRQMVDISNGNLVVTPKKTGTFTFWLLVEDMAAAATIMKEYDLQDGQVEPEWNEMVVAQWTFTVVEREPFKILSYVRVQPSPNEAAAETAQGEAPAQREAAVPTAAASAKAVVISRNNVGSVDCTVGTTYRIAAIDLETIKYEHAGGSGSGSGGGKEGGAKLQFMLKGAPDGFFISSDTAEILAVPQAPTATADVNTASGSKPERVTVQLLAVDEAGGTALVENMSISVRFKDTDIASNGPNERGCENGKTVDETLFDSSFTCDCAGTIFSGKNCETEREPVVQQSTSNGGVVGGLLGSFVRLTVGFAIAYKVRASNSFRCARLISKRRWRA